MCIYTCVYICIYINKHTSTHTQKLKLYTSINNNANLHT